MGLSKLPHRFSELVTERTRGGGRPDTFSNRQSQSFAIANRESGALAFSVCKSGALPLTEHQPEPQPISDARGDPQSGTLSIRYACDGRHPV